MNSSRPYLIRALHEWIVDNQCTPHLLVNATYPGTQVPEAFVSDGQIVLNVSPRAVRYHELGNDAVRFEGSFSGMAQRLIVPMGAIMGIYARENGEGMVFESDVEEFDEPTPPTDEPPRPSGRPSLKVVK